jgi:hypothetical protein
MNTSRIAILALCLPLAAGVLMPACDDSDESASNITFAAEDPLFPDFDFSTGLQPAASPVQASFTITANGASHVSASAKASGSEDSPTLTGLPQTGALNITGGFGMEGQLKIDISGLPSYDGPIPGIENVDIPFTGSNAFSPFAIETPVSTRAAIPPQRLPEIPLPGGIPGQLVLEVAEGSFIETSFSGTCAGISGTQASYTGSIDRAGSLVIQPSVEVEVPLIGTQVFEIPSFTVDLALGSSDLSMTAAVDTFGDKPEAGDHREGACTPTGTSGSGGGGAGGSGEGGSAVGGGGAGGSGVDGGTATLEIDGVVMTITHIALWPAGGYDDNTHVFIQFEGPRFDGNSDMAIDIVEAGSGCAMGNSAWLRPDVANQLYPDQYVSTEDYDCGLEILTVPTMSGQSAVGSFSGYLDALQSSTTPEQAFVELSFDAIWP